MKNINFFKIEAPVRVDFCGGFTDVPEISKVTGTAIANFAVDLYKDFQRKDKVPFYVANRCKSKKKKISTYESNLLRLLKNHSRSKYNYSSLLSINCGIPVSTGMGTSSALSVMLTAAHKVYYGLNINNISDEIFKYAFDFERHSMKVTGGYQDYIGAILGGYNFITALNKKYLINKFVEHRKLKGEIKKYINSSTFIIYNPRVHDSSGILKDIISQIKNNRRIKESLFKIKECNINLNNYFSSNTCHKLYELFDYINQSWQHQKRLSRLVDNKVLRFVEKELKKEVCGVHGIGAGGGTIILYGKENSNGIINEKINRISKKIPIKCFFPKINNLGLKCTFLRK